MSGPQRDPDYEAAVAALRKPGYHDPADVLEREAGTIFGRPGAPEPEGIL